ncbi:L-threonylcarbamoyladenylate synthase [Marinobacterium jannaschii]|uniref:L-threonylcarbamoyladenylate synthase n=1 Tax=Marinobacterium jannaschii TaxID=64970 RepID=UPI00047F65CC|nr:L-threonylcarbamoyladenylate synthase [Marinobacterium jannaschii]
MNTDNQSGPVRQAVQAMREGGVIAYPTEAVWGLGCDPFNHQAVERLLALKSRPVEKGVILIAAELQQVEFLLAALSDDDRKRVTADWPGPVTWVLPDPQKQIPDWIKGQHSGVAVRVSAHTKVQELCLAFGGPLVSTSANPAGEEPARSQSQVDSYFNGRLDAVVPGKLGDLAQPTQIRDLKNDRVLRT